MLERLDLLKLARAGAVMQGVVLGKTMSRLASALVSPPGEIEAELEFELDESRRPVVSGYARTEVELICQRCLEPFRHPLSAEFTLVQVQSEAEAERLTPEVDPLLSDEPWVRSAQLIEDELILALPIIAVHADASVCAPTKIEAQPAAATVEKPNPFAALANLKRNEH